MRDRKVTKREEFTASEVTLKNIVAKFGDVDIKIVGGTFTAVDGDFTLTEGDIMIFDESSFVEESILVDVITKEEFKRDYIAKRGNNEV